MNSDSDFLKTLIAWADVWRPPGHAVTVSRSPTDRPKIAAWLNVEGPVASGTVIVWDTGECEVETFASATSDALWVETLILSTPEELTATLRRFATFFDEPSGDIAGH